MKFKRLKIIKALVLLSVFLASEYTSSSLQKFDEMQIINQTNLNKKSTDKKIQKEFIDINGKKFVGLLSTVGLALISAGLGFLSCTVLSNYLIDKYRNFPQDNLINKINQEFEGFNFLSKSNIKFYASSKNNEARNEARIVKDIFFFALGIWKNYPRFFRIEKNTNNTLTAAFKNPVSGCRYALVNFIVESQSIKVKISLCLNNNEIRHIEKIEFDKKFLENTKSGSIICRVDLK